MDMGRFSQNVQALFAQTLVGDYDSDPPWQAVHTLRILGTTEVFDLAVSKLQSLNSVERARAADILAQIDGGKREEFSRRAYPLIVSLLETEQDHRAIASSIHALGHLECPVDVEVITKFHQSSEASIRFAVASALSSSLANEPVAVKCLLVLMQDHDQDVRDWATFSLGVQGEADSPEIRKALIERLEDSFEDVRLEAIEGLAKRRDINALQPILLELDQSDASEFHVPGPIIDACRELLDLEVVPDGWEEAEFAEALRSKFKVRSSDNSAADQETL